MDNYKEITSVNNSYVKDICKLKIKKYRDANKKYIIEGYNLISESREYLDKIIISDKKDLNIYPNIEHILVSYEVLCKICDTQTPQGIAGICNYKESKEISSNRVLILDGIQDPGNLGTLIRTAIAFGYTDIVLNEECVDLYNDKVIRSTQGGIFKVNIIRLNKGEISNFIKELKKKGYYIIGTSLQSSVNINKLDVSKLNCVGVVLGNEGNGISDEVLLLTDINVIIPIRKEMESLNVAIAGGIVMHKISG